MKEWNSTESIIFKICEVLPTQNLCAHIVAFFYTSNTLNTCGLTLTCAVAPPSLEGFLVLSVQMQDIQILVRYKVLPPVSLQYMLLVLHSVFYENRRGRRQQANKYKYRCLGLVSIRDALFNQLVTEISWLTSWLVWNKKNCFLFAPLSVNTPVKHNFALTTALHLFIHFYKGKKTPSSLFIISVGYLKL